jgi:hypothetical protein
MPPPSGSNAARRSVEIEMVTLSALRARGEPIAAAAGVRV